MLPQGQGKRFLSSEPDKSIDGYNSDLMQAIKLVTLRELLAMYGIAAAACDGV